MKKFKKLIPAFCMLLISAMLMGTSTYAWFSMNKTVTATNMSITAKANNPFLQISSTSNSTGFDTTTALDKKGEDLKLVTPLNAGTLVEYYANADAASADNKTTPTEATNAAGLLWGTASSSKPGESQGSNVPTLIENDKGNEYFVSSALWIKVVKDGANGTNLKASCKLNSPTTNTIADAVRVLLITEDGKYVIFDKDGTVMGGDAVLAATLTAGKTGGDEGTVLKVTAYVYFDGTHNDAYTEKATDLSQVAVDLTFTID